MGTGAVLTNRFLDNFMKGQYQADRDKQADLAKFQEAILGAEQVQRQYPLPHETAASLAQVAPELMELLNLYEGRTTPREHALDVGEKGRALEEKGQYPPEQVPYLEEHGRNVRHEEAQETTRRGQDKTLEAKQIQARVDGMKEFYKKQEMESADFQEVAAQSFQSLDPETQRYLMITPEQLAAEGSIPVAAAAEAKKSAVLKAFEVARQEGDAQMLEALYTVMQQDPTFGGVFEEISAQPEEPNFLQKLLQDFQTGGATTTGREG